MMLPTLRPSARRSPGQTAANSSRRSGFANDDLVRVKAGNLLIGQGQQFAQDLFVMLAEAVGGDFAPFRPSGKFYWQPGDIEFADRLVPDPPDGSALAQMRMGAHAGIAVVSYEDTVVGTVTRQGYKAKFVDVLLHPKVVLEPGSDTEKAKALHEKAHNICVVANSMNFPVRYEAEVIFAGERVATA